MLNYLYYIIVAINVDLIKRYYGFLFLHIHFFQKNRKHPNWKPIQKKSHEKVVPKSHENMTFSSCEKCRAIQT